MNLCYCITSKCYLIKFSIWYNKVCICIYVKILMEKKEGIMHENFAVYGVPLETMLAIFHGKTFMVVKLQKQYPFSFKIFYM